MSTDMRAALEAAFDETTEDENEVEAAGGDEPESEVAGEAESDEQIELFASSEEVADDLSNDDSDESEGEAATADDDEGDDAHVDEEAGAGDESPASESASDAEETDGSALEVDETDKPEAVKAPAHWKPDAREHWSKLPPEVQREAVHHERKMDETLREAAGYRKIAQEYIGVLEPYKGLFQAQGATPSQAVSGLLSTAAQLTSGTPAKKAKVVAEMIKEYGVPIETLDEALSGAELPDDSESRLLQKFEEKLKPITETLSSFQNQQKQTSEQEQQQIAQEIEQFSAKNEFFSDVREEMADLVELAQRRGQNLSLQEAYDKACALNPSISAVLQKRNALKSKQLDADEAAKKKKAASSISGSPSGSKGRKAPTSLRGQLAAAFDDIGGS